MPSEGDIFGETSVFGVGVRFEANCRAALDEVMALYPCNSPPGMPADRMISVGLFAVLKGAIDDVPATVADGCLVFAEGGIALSGNGRMGRGSCRFARDRPTSARDGFRNMVNTLVLFLVAQAGRVPVHASAIMLEDTAVVLAGRSGVGKSTLSLEADRAGLAVLSDDTVYVQLEPRPRLWGRPDSIHVYERDAPPGGAGGMRYRSGRWKRALPIAKPRMKADRFILCVLERGNVVGLELIPSEEAIAQLTHSPEPGYEFYGARARDAIGALGRDGCWRLRLSANPAEAIRLLCSAFANGDGR